MNTIRRKLLDSMFKIRCAEEKIVEVYAKEQMMRTPTHLSIGQEAVAAGLSLALREEDQIFTGHRCHAAYLTKGGDFNAFFAELCGRVTGISGGRAGSAHLTDPSAHIYSSPILGAMIPVAVGAALSFKMEGRDKVAAAIFGDAAIEEGVFSESVNFAVTKKLPVLFLCENNLYSTHSPLSVRQPPSQVYERLRAPDFKTSQVDGNDAQCVYEHLSKVIEEIRRAHMPQLVECLTYRFREHVGPLFDYDRGYRSKEEVDGWMAQCPIKRFTAKLIQEKSMTQQEIDATQARWKKLADEAYVMALNSPWPGPESLLEKVY
ncbi:MAG: thiamine pyrophosphate-dependent dehydrogenase E1 component subunit alpha [Candidatus Omnitrophica bacterium]|nr:thiamine pyrophosphate-dependent dehydrogenase E1 component subunit alpha [Candidatus Omnitrophota bacterium]